MKLDPKKTMVLTLDMRQGIFEFVPGAGRMRSLCGQGSRCRPAGAGWG